MVDNVEGAEEMIVHVKQVATIKPINAEYSAMVWCVLVQNE